MHAWQLMQLANLGVVRARGLDAVRFLQGQLSNDVARLGTQRSFLAGYHNPQGRTIALLRLVQLDQDDILAVLPAELAPVVAARLSKFVLRAKVKITEESSGWTVSGIVGPSASAAELRDLQRRADAAVIRIGDHSARWLMVSAVGQPATELLSSVLPGITLSQVDAGVEAWRALDISAGIPQVYQATAEEFVAQMLNLDALDAIAFDKGCYTGQEVIARAHYRGKIKRRMQQFESLEPCQLVPGQLIRLGDGRTAQVVDAVQTADGRCHFLAVAPLASAEPDGQPAAAQEGGPSAHTLVNAKHLPLPYSLPD